MSTLQSLRKRINSVHNIQHITQAMEVVAGVHFRKLSHRMEMFTIYSKKLNEIIDHLKLANADVDHPLFQERPTGRVGIIIVGGDKGLCGSYNANLLRAADKFVAGFDKRTTDLFLFGHKAVEHFSKAGWTIKKNVPDLARKLMCGEVRKWSEEFMTAYSEHAFDELWVVHTHFKNILSREPRIEQLLPLKKDSTQKDAKPLDFIFEPTPREIYQSIIPHFFYAKIQSILFESYASELTSRIVSMKAATKNAEEMIETLTLLKNKSRQAGITKEILEITAGAEGLK